MAPTPVPVIRAGSGRAAVGGEEARGPGREATAEPLGAARPKAGWGERR